MTDNMKVPPFIPGLKLAEGFYREAVAPILAARFPGMHELK